MMMGRRAQCAIWALAASGMMVLGCPASAGTTVTPVGSGVPEAVSAGAMNWDPCSTAAQGIWNAVNELVGLIPGVGSAVKAMSSFSKVARFSRCQGSGNQTVITLSEFTDAMEPIAENAADEQARHQLEVAVSDLVSDLRNEEENVKDFDNLTKLEKGAVISRIDKIASDASIYEKEATTMQFWVVPTFRVAAGLKNLAYNIEYDLLPDGQLKAQLFNTTIPNARYDSIVRLLKIESGFESYIKNSKLDRGYTSNKSDGGVYHYRIHAEATRNGLVEYQQDWSCTRKFIHPNECSERDSRRNEFFSKARDKALDIRESLAKAFDANYLSFKNRMSVYNFLREETKAGFYIKNDLSNNCMVIDQAGNISMTNAFDLCGSGIPGAPQSGTWQMVPESGQIESTSSKGMCLDIPANQVSADYPRVMLRKCQDPDPDTGALPEGSTQAWGFHPLGLIVNLATNKCLTSPSVMYNGALLVASDCNYRYPPPDDFSPKHGVFIPGYGVQHGDAIFSGQYWFVADSPWWNLPDAPYLESGDLYDDGDGDYSGTDGF